jgi:hypothetical protein
VGHIRQLDRSSMRERERSSILGKKVERSAGMNRRGAQVIRRMEMGFRPDVTVAVGAEDRTLSSARVAKSRISTPTANRKQSLSDQAFWSSGVYD